ncbi:MAG: serine/threonine-protein kinase [Polyangiales bacterium]
MVRLLDSDGMGAVFEAKDLDTGDRVAIKWMRPEPGRRRSAHPGMLHEAQLAARIPHLNVIGVYDIDWEGPALFLVMELLEGEPLRAAMQRDETPLYTLIALLVDAMRGVAAAHRLGIVHRHLKPEAVFLAREEDRVRPVPKVLEFGIPKLLGSERIDLADPDVAVEALAYLSSEQLAGAADVDGRTDVYALGAILYEMATGRVPFQAADPVSLALKVASETPPAPRALCDDLPEALDALILRAIARDRAERVPTVEAFIDMLAPFATEAGFRAHMRQPTAELPRGRLSSPDDVGARGTTPNAPRATGLRVVGSLVLALGASGAWVALGGDDAAGSGAPEVVEVSAAPAPGPVPAPVLPPPALAKEPAEPARDVPASLAAPAAERRSPARTPKAKQPARAEAPRSASSRAAGR